MKKAEIKVGGMYRARISGKFVDVRVDRIRQRVNGAGRDATVFDVTNLTTGRTTTFASAAKFRGPAAGVQIPTRRLTEDEYAECVEVVNAKKSRMVADGVVADAPNVAVVQPTSEDKPNWAVVGPSVMVDVDPQLGERFMQHIVPEGENSPDFTIVSTVENSTPAVTLVKTAAETCRDNVTADADSTSSTVAHAVPTTSSLAARIAAQATPRATGLTRQQEDILATAKQIESARNNGQRIMVIGAGAGTGKTFTLKQLEQVLQGNGQYTAFNSSLVAESKAKFTRAACNTTHSLAFRAVGCRFKHRLNGARVRSWEVAQRLGIEDMVVELPPVIGAEGPPATRRLKASYLAGQVTDAIRKFCQSADGVIGTKHFKKFDGIDEPGKYANSDMVKAYLLPFAQKAWADLSDEKGELMPFNHDVYVKLWEQGRGTDRPCITAEYILLDEAQDTAPVMLSILQQQAHALLILVGDDNQQIYEWRGAVNAMAAFPGAARKLLSQSFRFGQVIADVANAVLSGLDTPTDLVMRGLESIPSRICPVASPRCYLYRTNAGAISRLMHAVDEGKRPYLIGGTSEVVTFCRAALDLQRGKGTTHPELGCFGKWAEVQEYSKESEGADLRLMVKLIDEFKAERIIAALENMPTEDHADMVISTAHRSKGREWATVQLGPDFPTANKLTDADRRLVYVAATRAQEELDLTKCPTFCGGYDQNTGQYGDYGEEKVEAKWIPGIRINYTVPMPTVEELTAYREGKKNPHPTAETPTTSPVSNAVASTHAATNNGNGVDGFTWANMDGQWLVRGPHGSVNQRVTVVRKNGSKSQEMLRIVVKTIGDKCFYATK